MPWFFTWVTWLLFACLFYTSLAGGDDTMQTFAFSGELLVIGLWIGWWLSGRKRKGE